MIGLVERGTIHFGGGGADAPLREGDVLFIAPNVVHEASGSGVSPWTYRALYLAPSQWEALCGPDALRCRHAAAVLRDRSLYGRVRVTHQRLMSGAPTARSLGDLVRRITDAVLATRERERPLQDGNDVVSTTLEQVRRTLDSEPARRVSLGDMASMAGLSRFHFLRTFARAYGISPYAYSLNRRLLEAQRRLSEGASIVATAHEVGFADQAHLTRHFLRTVGVTPGEYRRAFCHGASRC